ncbi:MAG: transporter [Patescibacteria group bacterium]|nr:transporter [Patescibacteria group bacterium]
MKKANVFEILGKYKWSIAILIFFTIAAGTLNLILPKITSSAIDAYTAGHLNALRVVLEFAGASVFIFLFTYLQSIMQVYASERVARDMRMDLATSISEESFLSVNKTTPAKLLTNLTSDADAVKSFVSMAFPLIISSAFMIIGASILLLTTNWKLGLAVLCIIPLVILTFVLIFGKIGGLFKKAQEVIDRLNRVITSSILGAAVIRVINSQAQEQDRFLAENTVSLDVGMSILRLFASMIPIITFISNLAMVAIVILGGRFVVLGGMSIGDFTAFQAYLALLSFPLIMIGFMANSIAAASASYGRIKSAMGTKRDDISGSMTDTIKGDVEIKNISLSLGGKEILKDISFRAMPGTKTAILGPTAAGKTQLLYLMIGLLKPDIGSIDFDGIALGNYESKTLYDQVGFVFQDSIMFNLTLRENIAFSNSVSDESLAKAIKTAELDTFIETLPHKLDTIVSERGTSLSGGQKQRVMLARALALDPKVLILDDFTARVDASTERKILENIAKNYPNLTLISVTQKVASVEQFDQVILMMEGELLAKGTHAELLETSPEYVQIVNSQATINQYEELPT